MAKADCHVHSSFSERPSEWFLQRIGTRESYIDPDNVYSLAKHAGMDFVTITDHNVIEGVLRLRDLHPADVFTGMETTAYFPEDGVKIHVLVWGLDEGHFAIIDKVRKSIYELREYLREEKLPHAVAHPTFSVNGLLTLEHVEQLFLLFDHFETRNGSRAAIDGDILSKVFASLTQESINELNDRYCIEPLNNGSWRKGAVGGSDDHSGLFVGTTFTEADAKTPEEFLQKVVEKKTTASGRNNDYRSLAFSIYKVAYDFSKTRAPMATTLMGSVNALLFDDKPFNFKRRIIFDRMKFSKAGREDPLRKRLAELIDDLQKNGARPTDEKLDLISDAITETSDILLRGMFEKLGGDMTAGDIMGIIKHVSGMLPGVFMSLPFFTSLNVISASRVLLDSLEETYVRAEHKRSKRVLWFSDTFCELSGVCATLQEMSRLALERGHDLTIATCLPPPEEQSFEIDRNVLDLPCIFSHTPEFFNSYTVRIPSVLSTIRLSTAIAPDEIYLSTPGPVGLVGLLVARLLHIPCTAVYHTDFTRQMRQILGDETMCRMTEDFVNWFYSVADSVAVSTTEYMTLMEQRGLPKSKMRRFRRGIDPDRFTPDACGRDYIEKALGIHDGFTLFHSGRVSREKNLDFLAEVYAAVLAEREDVNLIFVGNGPYLQEFQVVMAHHKRVYFAGRVERSVLPAFYSGADLLVFPSVTETFGLVVLEAQACGLPALVSDFGGPKEIIRDQVTGFVAEANNVDDWKGTILSIALMIETHPERYIEIREAARRHVALDYGWDGVFKDIFNAGRRTAGGATAPHDPGAVYADICAFNEPAVR
jgi:glycosyltransferase involved in cell wall biosynthesis